MSSEKPDSIRISVTLTKACSDALDYLVEEGIYMSGGELVREAIRRLLRSHGIEPFYPKGADPGA